MTYKFHYPVSYALKLALEPKTDLSPGDWLESVVWIKEGSPRLGKLRLDKWQRDIIDSIHYDRKVIWRSLQAPTQIGKTLTMMCIIVYSIFYLKQNTMIIFPNMEGAEKFFKQSLMPAIRNSPQIARYCSFKKTQFSKKGFVTKDGIECRLATAGSAAQICGFFAGTVIADEVDKWADFLDGEASPLKLSKDRLGAALKMRPCWIAASTPTTSEGIIHNLIEKSYKKIWMVECPSCKVYQKPDFDCLTRKHGEGEEQKNYSIKELEENHGLLRYRCNSCLNTISEAEFRIQSFKGKWVDDAEQKDFTGITKDTVSYQIGGLNAIARSFLQITTQQIKAVELGDYDELKDWRNSTLGEIYQSYNRPFDKEKLEKGTIPDLYYRQVDEYNNVIGDGFQCPDDTMALCCGVDCGLRTEKDKGVMNFWVSVLAVLPGKRYVLVGFDNVIGTQELYGLIGSEWTTQGKDGKPVRHIRPSIAFIDSNGSFRADVYNIALENPIFEPIIGKRDLQNGIITRRTANPLKDALGANRDRIAQLMVSTLHTTFFKDEFNNSLSYGSFKFANGLPKILFKHITNEVKKGVGHKWVWVPIDRTGKNHGLDSTCYSIAAAYALGLWNYNTWDEWAQLNDPELVEKQRQAIMAPYLSNDGISEEMLRGIQY